MGNRRATQLQQVEKENATKPAGLGTNFDANPWSLEYRHISGADAPGRLFVKGRKASRLILGFRTRLFVVIHATNVLKSPVSPCARRLTSSLEREVAFFTGRLSARCHLLRQSNTVKLGAGYTSYPAVAFFRRSGIVKFRIHSYFDIPSPVRFACHQVHF